MDSNFREAKFALKLVMHLSMLSPREGEGGGVWHGVGILTFSLKKNLIPHPWDKIIGQNPHVAASEDG